MVRQPEPTADRGDDRLPLPAPARSSSSNADEHLPVGGVEMAHRLVEQDEIEGLAQTADECDALLLPERELPGRSIPLAGDPRSFEQALDPVRVSKSEVSSFFSARFSATVSSPNRRRS